MKMKPHLFAAPFLALVLLGQGCLGGAPAAGPDGGVYRTRDSGLTWAQMKLLNLDTKIGSIANVASVTAAVDPQDPSTIYLGTNENGLLYSSNDGESWSQMKDKGLSAGKVQAVAVDPANKCVVYAAIGYRLFKTQNCLRDWNLVYSDSRTNIAITSLIIDWHNSNIVYFGTSAGDVFRSDNAATSWRAVQRVEENKINAIAMDPRDSRVIYVATEGSGIQKSSDGGANWERIYDQLKDFSQARASRLVVVDPNLANRVYIVAKYGILRSDDAGATWTALTLPTPPSSVDIKTFAVRPEDSRQLVYATDNAVVFSVDGGVTWNSKKLPTKRTVSFLMYDHATPEGLFLGASIAKSQ